MLRSVLGLMLWDKCCQEVSGLHCQLQRSLWSCGQRVEGDSSQKALACRGCPKLSLGPAEPVPGLPNQCSCVCNCLILTHLKPSTEQKQ